MPRALIAFEPPDGGVAEHVLQLALGLPEHGWTVEVAGPPETTIYSRLDAAGVPVRRLPLGRGYGRPWADLLAARQLSTVIRGGNFDLAHCHSAKAGAIGRAVARRVGVPVVYTPHGFGFVGEDVGRFRHLAVPVAERALGRATDALICVSEAELDIARANRIGDHSCRWRIYNASEPCDTGLEPPVSLKRVGRQGPQIGTIAVFRREKGIDLLLQAAPRVLAEVPDCSIAIIGDGPLREELSARAEEMRLTAEPRFAFLPFEPPSARYLQALDLFLLPSSREAFPMSILEALACGVPQVATDVGGTREAVSDETAVLVPPDSPDRLAAATIELLHDPVRRAAMATASRARYLQLFQVERMVAQTAGVYESVVGDQCDGARAD